jgi:hypothetical protein
MESTGLNSCTSLHLGAAARVEQQAAVVAPLLLHDVVVVRHPRHALLGPECSGTSCE